MFNSLYGRPHTVRTTVGRPDYLTIQPPVSASGFYFDLDSTWNLIVLQGCVIHGMISLIITFYLEHIVISSRARTMACHGDHIVVMIIQMLSSPHSNQPNDAMDFGYNQPIIKNTLLLARNILYIIQ